MQFRTEHACLLLVGVLALTLLVGGRNHGAETRHATGTVVEVGADVTIRTDDGHEWLYGHCGVEQGARVSVEFDTRGTDELADDVIIGVESITIGNGLRKTVVYDRRYTRR